MKEKEIERLQKLKEFENELYKNGLCEMTRQKKRKMLKDILK